MSNYDETESGEEPQDVYNSKGREDLVENDEISPEEEAFMEGYDESYEDEEEEEEDEDYDESFDE